MRKYVFRSASQQHDRNKATTYNKRKDIRWYGQLSQQLVRATLGL
jgi:hypothetical protein